MEVERVGREFNSLPECYEFVGDYLGERLKVVTDTPTEVSGTSAANGLFFICDVRETGTKGRVISGRWDQIPQLTPAQASQRIEDAKGWVRSSMGGAESIEFRGLYVSSSGRVCGEVRAPDTYGMDREFHPFIASSKEHISRVGVTNAESFEILHRLGCHQYPRH